MDRGEPQHIDRSLARLDVRQETFPATQPFIPSCLFIHPAIEEHRNPHSVWMKIAEGTDRLQRFDRRPVPQLVGCGLEFRPGLIPGGGGRNANRQSALTACGDVNFDSRASGRLALVVGATVGFLQSVLDRFDVLAGSEAVVPEVVAVAGIRELSEVSDLDAVTVPA